MIGSLTLKNGQSQRKLKTMTEIEFIRIKSQKGLATRKDLKKAVNKIMSAISDFAAAQSEFFNRVDTAVTGLQSDVTELKTLIEQLQASAGQISPEDQALLDQLQTRANTIASNLEALDAMTPPPGTPA